MQMMMEFHLKLANNSTLCVDDQIDQVPNLTTQGTEVHVSSVLRTERTV